jgi:ferredoxin
MSETTAALWLPRDRLQDLVDALRASGRRCIGPRVRDGAIVYDVLTDVADLPAGVHDVQAPGRYRLDGSGSGRRFAWANGPQALKPLLFAPREPLWRVVRGDDGALRFGEVPQAVGPVAVIGVRACDLAALALQDRHFLQGGHADPYYARRRENLFVVAVGCSHPAATCFCASTGDGPRPAQGYDVLLEELDEGCVAHAGSAPGRVLLASLAIAPADEAQLRLARAESERAVAMQTRGLPSRNLRDALSTGFEHPRWDDVAQRCLSCGNCTSVCPTCFCHSEHEAPALGGGASEHLREWDSCFARGHSYLHGFVVRPDTRSRYRQWLSHKLGAWHDQYGRSGCVGCGRCITWCPVGIDITEEAAAICAQPS